MERKRIKETDLSKNKIKTLLSITINSKNAMFRYLNFEIKTFESISRYMKHHKYLDTSLPGLVFSDQFIQLPIRLPTGSNLYGWGEATYFLELNPNIWAHFSGHIFNVQTLYFDPFCSMEFK